MSRVKLVEVQEADAKVEESYKSLEQSRGSVPNLFKALGYSANMLGPALGVADFTTVESKVPVKEKQLAYLATSRLNRCEYCLERHARAGLKAGLAQEQIDALYADTELADSSDFNAREQLIIRLAEELTVRASLSAATFEQLRPVFSDEELVEIAFVVASANMFNRLANGLRVELEPEFRR